MVFDTKFLKEKASALSFCYYISADIAHLWTEAQLKNTRIDKRISTKEKVSDSNYVFQLIVF